MSPTGTIGKRRKSAATTDQENDLALVDDENESHKDDVRLGAIVQEKKIGTKNNGGKDADHEATTSLKVAKKGRTKKEKAPAKKDTKVASSSWNVDHDVVIGDPQENVDKVVRKSSKKSKKKQSSDFVE
ncbi:hypothetical protein AtEden1_Chr1g0055191 [Arabidopsis thaliana]